MDVFLDAPTETIQAGIPRTKRYIRLYDRIGVSISGGADSDCMLDVLQRIGIGDKARYFFFNTGVEMRATFDHIKYLEQKYNINIEKIEPKKHVPTAVKLHGIPFMSKKVAEYIDRLQAHGFEWEDKPLSYLLRKYDNCRAALRWWCNDFGGKGRMDIDAIKHLKHFLIENPPNFRISAKCCDCAKKEPAHRVSKLCDIQFIGVRRAEGGARATTYTSCFAETKYGVKHFPLFWWSDTDRKEYEKRFDIIHSAAYTKYGCNRTGCAGCPFGSGFEDELKMLEANEPQLAKAANNIFGASYEYTRAFRQFKKDLKWGVIP